MKRIIIVRSNQINPDPRVEKIAETLCRAGFEVSVLSWNRNDFSLPDVEVKILNASKYKIIRKRIPAQFGGGIKNLFSLFLWQIFLMYWLIKNRFNYELIYACDFDTVLPAILMKLIFKKKLIYDVFDYYVDSFKVPSIFKPIIKKLDKWSMIVCDKLIICDENRVEQIAYNNLEKITVIPNSPKDLLSYFDNSNNLRYYRKNDNFTLAYVGILQEGRFLVEMIEIFKKNFDWNLIIAGFGPLEEYIKKSVTANITFLGKLSYIEAMRLYYESDAIFAIYNPRVPNHKFSSPNKVFEAMMLSKPIIVAKGTGIDKFVEKYKIGLSVDYNDIKEVEEVIIRLNNKEYQLELGLNGRSLYEKEYKWEKLERRLLDVIEGIL